MLPSPPLKLPTLLLWLPDSATKIQGIIIGKESAAATIAKRADDNGTMRPFLNKNCPKPK
jgi:hypothetical protein